MMGLMRSPDVTIQRPADAVRLAQARRLAASGTGRRIRLQSGLSIRQTAAGARTSHTTVLRWESGAAQPSGAAALRWAELLGRLAEAAS